MLKNPHRLVVPDESGRTSGILMQVNWNKKVANCSHIKIRIGEQETVVKREHLEAILFMLGDENSQAKFVHKGLKLTKKHKIPVQLFVKAAKDIRRGEMIIVPYMKEVTEEEYEWNRLKKAKTIVV